MPSQQRLPDGIEDRHGRPWRWAKFAALLPMLVLAALLGLALVGTFGGGSEKVWVADTPSARLRVTAPEPLRNGMFFEMRIAVDPRRPFEDLTIVVSESLWRQFTINTEIPAPAEETFSDGRFHFAFGPVDAGEALVLKVDGQINPPLTLGNKGEIALYDGDRRIAVVPMTIRVLP